MPLMQLGVKWLREQADSGDLQKRVARWPEMCGADISGVTVFEAVRLALVKFHSSHSFHDGPKGAQGGCRSNFCC